LGDDALKAIAHHLEQQGINGLVMIGGWDGYAAVNRLYQARATYPTLDIPIICLPASIDNNLPGSELSIGADTALNSIVSAVDKIKQSAVAARRVFVVEVMGGDCGYLALMSGLATGAERVYLPEEGITLKDLQQDLEQLTNGFEHGKRLGLLIRSENANPTYNTNFISALLKEEGGDLFEVRHAILGHLQQGGDPTPFDRIQATRLAAHCIESLIEQVDQSRSDAVFIGLEHGKIQLHHFNDYPGMIDPVYRRPKEQWWLNIREVARVLAQPGPSAQAKYATALR
jgi:6-phosphofructokinase 1